MCISALPLQGRRGSAAPFVHWSVLAVSCALLRCHTCRIPVQPCCHLLQPAPSPRPFACSCPPPSRAQHLPPDTHTHSHTTLWWVPCMQASTGAADCGAAAPGGSCSAALPARTALLQAADGGAASAPATASAAASSAAGAAGAAASASVAAVAAAGAANAPATVKCSHWRCTNTRHTLA